MILALEGNFAYAFVLGVLATVNPCGFVLLPTYLMYFLGLEGARPGSQRTSLLRALFVGAAVSLGFFAVFLLIGVATRLGLGWFDDVRTNGWLSVAVGVLLLALGVAMMFGFRLKVATPRLDAGGRGRDVASMFLYGISYAVASIGCTLPLFANVILPTVSRQGLASGFTSIALYGAGMGLTLTALTVSLALARTGLLTVLRRVMAHLDRIAAVFLLLTGLYLILYGYGAIANRSTAVTDMVEEWQAEVATWLQDRGAVTLAVAFGGVTVAALAFVLVRRDRASSRVE